MSVSVLVSKRFAVLGEVYAHVARHFSQHVAVVVGFGPLTPRRLKRPLNVFRPSRPLCFGGCLSRTGMICV